VGSGVGRGFCAGGDVAGEWWISASNQSANSGAGVVLNAENEATRHKAIDFFKRE
jgi:hypothetical protein